MKLRLQFAPTPENAPRHAALCVEGAKAVSGVDLDYSPASLHLVDEIIEGFRRDGVSSQEVAETLFTFGCYVGEVFVRNAGGVWRNAEETPMRDVATFVLVIELSEHQSICNPIGKAFKRLDNGPEDSLAYFYKVFTKQEVPEPPKKKPWWRAW